MRKFFNAFAAKTSTAAGQPLTFVIAFLVIVFGVMCAIPWYGTTGGRDDKRFTY